MVGQKLSRRAALIGAVALGYGGLLAYIWFDALSNGWGWGWALVGVFNITAAAFLVLALAWVIGRTVRRFRSNRR